MDERIGEFAEAVEGREIKDLATLKEYVHWAERFELWRPGGEPDIEMMRDFDSFLYDETTFDYPWTNQRGAPAPRSYDYSTRVKALSGIKHWVKYEYGVTIDKEDTTMNELAYGEPSPFDPTVLPPGEIQWIFDHADACGVPGCRAATRVGYDCLLRGAEICNILREDVDLQAGTLYVRSVKKSNRVTMGIGRDALKALADFLRASENREHVFHNSYGKPWKPNAWSMHFRREHHPVGWHAVGRHSAVTNRLLAGEDFGDVFRRARHQNPQMTLRYASLVDVDSPEWANGG